MKYIIIAFWVILLSFFTTPTTFACSCIGIADPEGALESSDAVFTGKVLGISGMDVRILPYEVFKGNISDEIVIKTFPDSASCGYPFENEKDYIIYSYLDEKEEYNVSLCSRTAPISSAEEDLSVLGNGTEINPYIIEPNRTTPGPFGPIILPLMAIIGISITILTVIIVIKLRKRSIG